MAEKLDNTDFHLDEENEFHANNLVMIQNKILESLFLTHRLPSLMNGMKYFVIICDREYF